MLHSSWFRDVAAVNCPVLVSWGVKLGKKENAIFNIIIRMLKSSRPCCFLSSSLSPPLMSPANVEDALGVAGLSFTTFLIFKAAFFAAEATQQSFLLCLLRLQRSTFAFAVFRIFTVFMHLQHLHHCYAHILYNFRAVPFHQQSITGCMEKKIIRQSSSCAYAKGQRSDLSCCCVFLLLSASPGTNEFPVLVFVL